MSEYSIRILSERAEEVKEDLARLVAEEDQLAEEHQRLREKLAELEERRGEANAKTTGLRGELIDLRNDIARLQETKPNGAPDPGPVPEPRRTPEIDRGIRERHEAEEAARSRSRDPLRVRPQENPTHVGAPGSKKPRKWQNAEPVDLDTVNETWWERAELAYEVLAEAEGGRLSQMEWGRRLSDLLDAKPQTGASILSHCIGILQTVKRVLWTGEHESKSAVWVTEQHASAELRAAAGLGTGEENFAGKTTQWPTPSTSPPKGSLIREEQGSYEGGKRR